MILGAVSEPYVPYKEDGGVDYGLVRESISALQEKGVKGFMFNGIGGEALALSIDERKRVLEESAKVLRSGVEAAVLIAHPTISGILELARHAKEHGIRYGVITQFPTYPLRFPEKLYSHIASRSGLELILYNEKALDNLLSPQQVNRILRIDGFVGYKDSTKDASHLQEVFAGLPAGKTVLAGSDSMIYITYALGGRGIVSLIIDVVPGLIIDLVKRLESGDMKGALQLQHRVNEVRGLLKSSGFSAGYRCAAKAFGIDFGLPLYREEALEKKECESLVEKLRNELSGYV